MSVYVHLIRHGQSTANRNRQIAGWTDAELTERGIAQAQQLSQRLDPTIYDSVWSSDLSRARETARLAGLLAATEDQRIRELNFGTLEAQPWETVAETHGVQLGDFDAFVPPAASPSPRCANASSPFSMSSPKELTPSSVTAGSSASCSAPWEPTGSSVTAPS